MFHKNGLSRALSTFVLATILLAACSLPTTNTASTPAAQITPEMVYTSAVETVVAQLTSAAVTPGSVQPTETAPAVVTAAPATQAPATPTVIQPSNTVAPTQAPQSSPTPTRPKATATIRPTATTSANDPAQSLGDPTFQDKFSSDKNWSLSADKHTDMFIKDGKLVMTAFDANQFDGWALTWPKTINAYLELTATTHTCSGLDRYGLMVRAKQDASVGYLFGFSCDGRYSFRKWDGVKYTRFVDWTKSSSIQKGSNQTNRLGIQADGDHFTLYANGVKLTDLHDASYTNGYFGVFVAAAETANFTVDATEIDYWELP